MLPKPVKDEYRRSTSVSSQTNVEMPMRDGVILRADVYRPAGAGRHPVLLQRIPYGKHTPRYRSLYLDPMRALDRGYAVVIQEVRGRHVSDGDWYPYVHEAQDGYDTIDWIASQPWSDGSVGTFGISYHGATQWLAATEAHPALKAIIPGVTSDSYYDSWTYLGGVFQLFWTSGWASAFAMDDLGGRAARNSDAMALLREWRQDSHAMANHLPLDDMPGLRQVAAYYYDWLAHPTYDNYWKAIAPREKFDRITVPALNQGGWFDGFIRGTLRCYQGMRERGATEVARTQQHLVVGPWLHQPLPDPFAGQGYFGGAASGAAIDWHGMQIAWFDRWLRDEDNGVDTDPNTYIFIMGANEWRAEESWPPPDAEPMTLFLRSGGRANTLNGDGALSLDAPSESESPDRFTYDPSNPVPTHGGAHLGGIVSVFEVGVQDQRAIEAREEVLAYTSEPLERDTEVTGHVELELWAVTSVTDTDWTAKLVDVHPDGQARNVCDGILRASFRDSLESPSPIQPGEAYRYNVDVGPTAMLFRKGHCIRLEVSSSNFPAYARNTGSPHHQSSDLTPATQTVLHDASHPSHLTLPVVRRN
ncbi:MAG: CocE/NonD family hydrolase [Dehalococcoidia bacterium]|nr:CocE/NonD family hydrolase [Dehalococcoidia bacterium]